MDPIQWREDIKCLFFSFRSFSLFFFFLQCIISWVPQLMEIIWKTKTPKALGEYKCLSGANLAKSHGL